MHVTARPPPTHHATCRNGQFQLASTREKTQAEFVERSDSFFAAAVSGVAARTAIGQGRGWAWLPEWGWVGR